MSFYDVPGGLSPAARSGYVDGVVDALWEAYRARMWPAESDAPASYRPTLCWRCEHRARFHEFGHAARYECGQPWSVCSCYMYAPVAPMVQARNPGDKRDVHLPWVFSPRCTAVRIAGGETFVRSLPKGQHVKLFHCNEEPRR